MLRTTANVFENAPAELAAAERSRDDKIGAGSSAERSPTVGSPFPSSLRGSTSGRARQRGSEGGQERRAAGSGGSSCIGDTVTQLRSVLPKSTREGHGHTAMRAEAAQETLEKQSRSNPQLHRRIKHLLPLKSTSGTPRGAEGADTPSWAGAAAGQERCRPLPAVPSLPSPPCHHLRAITSLPPPAPASSRASMERATPRSHNPEHTALQGKTGTANPHLTTCNAKYIRGCSSICLFFINLF